MQFMIIAGITLGFCASGPWRISLSDFGAGSSPDPWAQDGRPSAGGGTESSAVA